MLGWILSILIDVIDATPIEDATVVGIPLVALIEGAIIYSQTKSWKWTAFGVVESLIPGVDVIPGAVIAKIFGPKPYY